MRNPKRINTILELIKTIWEKNPELRLGQLIGNSLPTEVGFNGLYRSVDTYYLEDYKLEEYLREFYNVESK